MLLVTLPLIVLFSYGMLTQLVLGKPWGSRPMSDTGLAIVGPLAIGISVLVLCAFYWMRMVTEVRHDGVYVNDNHHLLFLEADTVVLAVGTKPNRHLTEELKGIVPEVYSIGDCVEPRDALDAIREGAELGRKIE